jgi:hypothetical protein
MIQAEAGGCVALRVEVDHQDSCPRQGEVGTNVHRCRGLADSPLLVGDSKDTSVPVQGLPVNAEGDPGAPCRRFTIDGRFLTQLIDEGAWSQWGCFT